MVASVPLRQRGLSQDLRGVEQDFSLLDRVGIAVALDEPDIQFLILSKTFLAASTVASISSSPCAADTNPASKADGAR